MCVQNELVVIVLHARPSAGMPCTRSSSMVQQQAAAAARSLHGMQNFLQYCRSTCTVNCKMRGSLSTKKLCRIKKATPTSVVLVVLRVHVVGPTWRRNLLRPGTMPATEGLSCSVPHCVPAQKLLSRRRRAVAQAKSGAAAVAVGHLCARATSPLNTGCRQRPRSALASS